MIAARMAALGMLAASTAWSQGMQGSSEHRREAPSVPARQAPVVVVQHPISVVQRPASVSIQRPIFSPEAYRSPVYQSPAVRAQAPAHHAFSIAPIRAGVSRPSLRDAAAGQPQSVAGSISTLRAVRTSGPAPSRPLVDIRPAAPAASSAEIAAPSISKRDMIWDHRQMSAPKIDENGRSLRLSAVVNPPTVRSLGSASWNSEAERLERDEQAHGTYYWHEDHGRRFVHFADNWGDHWFGFQKGDSFFWLRNHMGRWWWHDPVGNRWLFWANGSWCWQNPVTFEIVYVGSQGQETPAPAVADANAIYPAQSQQEPPASEDSADASQLAAPVVASEGAPADAAAPDQTFYSGDRTRMVAIYGADHDALLFDTSGAGDPVYLADLAQGVRDADFFQAKPGDPLDIVLFMEDGSLQRFGADGKPFDSANGTDPAGATDLSAPPFGASEQAPIDAGLGPAD